MGSLAMAQASNHQVIRVPADHPTIQGGIDAASEGDTVLVAPGFYKGPGNKNLNSWGRDLVIKSEAGADSTVIHCGRMGRGFEFFGGESADFVVEGFTIQNGSAAWGGAVYCDDARPTIQDCVFANNSGGRGGSIYCYESSPGIKRCEFLDNHADVGGGISCEQYSKPRITDCLFTGNTAAYGGSVDCTSFSAPYIKHCVLSDNVATHEGGAILSSGAQPRIYNSTVSNNVAGRTGGGMKFYDSDPSVRNSIISHNRANGTGSRAGGGGIYSENSYSSFVNCVISENSAPLGAGGAILIRTFDSFSRSGQYTNCTVTGNTANEAGGIHCDTWDELKMTNCIHWGNDPVEIEVRNQDPYIRHSNVEGSWPGEGNMDADPRFRSAKGYDYVLAPGSPCIDAGTGENDGLDWGSLAPRYGPHNSPLPDMGAYGGPGAGAWLD